MLALDKIEGDVKKAQTGRIRRNGAVPRLGQVNRKVENGDAPINGDSPINEGAPIGPEGELSITASDLLTLYADMRVEQLPS